MEPTHKNTDAEKKIHNAEYLPTKCRVTKPPPPKPATNPLQFVKVAPCPLFQKAQEQIKKVEEVKVMRKDVREEAEDWQANLDNWKSSRRKRQEHIIERVVEVKKLEQEENEKSRRRNTKTFSEMMEERSKGRHKFNIPIYNDDDSNDLSDYGIGSSSSKTNSIKDIDTDDNSSILDEKDVKDFDFVSNKDSFNQSNSEDETTAQIVNETSYSCSESYKEDSSTDEPKSSLYVPNVYANLIKNSYTPLKTSMRTNYDCILGSTTSPDPILTEKQEYTYEGAIQDYRTRIRSKINIDESVFNRPYESRGRETEVQSLIPKGNIFKRKEIFEIESNRNESNGTADSSRRFSEDFANTQTIKERLQSLEKCTDQYLKGGDKNINNQIGPSRTRSQIVSKQNDNDAKNNNNNTNVNNNVCGDVTNNNFYKRTNTVDYKGKEIYRSSSPDTEIYMNKLNMFNRDLDTLLYGKSIHSVDNDLDDYLRGSNYPPSTSSTELMTLSSDREDSGIHTADVSCSVSQADELFEEVDLPSTMPNFIEDEKSDEMINGDKKESKDALDNVDSRDYQSGKDDKGATEDLSNRNERYDSDQLEEITRDFLQSEREDALGDDQKNTVDATRHLETYIIPQYENVEIKTSDVAYSNFIVTDVFGNSLTPPKLEPPKAKPPPPPLPEIRDDSEVGLRRMNSAKRIKKEIQIKRSSFLGLDEPTDDQIDPEIPIDKPPDIDSFLQKESRLEKSMYKRLQSSRDGGFSEVESQDSGLEIERGRLSSDTWCSSLLDSSTPVHERQDSEQTFTSEEDEITKKEREIIKLVEKEEKSKDSDYSSQTTLSPVSNKNDDIEKINGSSYFLPRSGYSTDNLDTRDSEVLRVEHELLQLEMEEKKRRRESLLFEGCVQAQRNRRSLENVCDIGGYDNYNDNINYRKSMPELQHIPLEYRASMSDVSNYKHEMLYRKSMPNIQNAYSRSASEYCNSTNYSDNSQRRRIDHGKSLPELQRHVETGFRSPPPIIIRQQPIMPAKPLRVVPKEQRDRLNPEPERVANKQTRPLAKHILHTLSAVPRPRHLPNDNWIQPRQKDDYKNYNQHWLYQEAEFRRLSEQNNQNRNWQQSKPDKHIPDSVIQSLTQRVQHRGVPNDRNPTNVTHFRPECNPNKEFKQHPSYLGNRPQTLGHAFPLSYPSPVQTEDTQDKMLSVSGKKKCSNCGNELGRGAAMIIESLCLFYHMECFKCCVCHVRLGDGLMGTDVRVRNQKLHCHNCYSSEDGIKFSCV